MPQCHKKITKVGSKLCQTLNIPLQKPQLLKYGQGVRNFSKSGHTGWVEIDPTATQFLAHKDEDISSSGAAVYLSTFQLDIYLGTV